VEKLIIQVRVNEGQLRAVSPNVPYSPSEIAAQTIECARAGASMVHYHARDPETGAKSGDVGLYAESVRLIKKESDIITFPTLGAAMTVTAADRIAHIVSMAADEATRPDCVPVDMGTTNLTRYDPQLKQFTGDGDQIYLNTVTILRELCTQTRAVGVTPVSMIWDHAGVRLTEAFQELGLYDERLLCELTLFGDPFRGYGTPGTIRGLQSTLDTIPAGARWNWMTNVVGGNAFPVLAAAIGLGGHVAVGVADYPYPELGYPTNAQLVGYVAEIARYMGREVATPAEARDLLAMA
jgi:3-keto-5-aminohexanoate cleavage enzyme